MRVLLADGSILTRTALAALLADTPGTTIAGEASDAAELLRQARTTAPQLCLVDSRLPRGGLQAAAELRAAGLPVLILATDPETPGLSQLLAHGLRGLGWLVKDDVEDVEEFTAAMRRVADGGSVIAPAALAQAAAAMHHTDPMAGFTTREREVLGLMANGLSNHGIAAALDVTHRAVEKHIRSIFTRLTLPPEEAGHHRRVLAVLAFLRADAQQEMSAR